MMSGKRKARDLTVDELEQLLYSKKREQRQQRLQRLKKEGRVIEVAGKPAPNPTPPPLTTQRPLVTPAGALRHYTIAEENDEGSERKAAASWRSGRRIQWRWIANKTLLAVEVLAIISFASVLFSLWNTGRELNQELAAVQRQEVQTLAEALPTPTAAPVIDVVVLPSGHRIVNGIPEQGEAGDIPDHLRPIINAYVAPAAPPPSPEQARRIQIPAIGVDSTIVLGDDWEQLKKGVAHHIGSAQPGQTGNLVLSAHNDIYGEIFRHLDKLQPGDEIIVYTELQSYTYVVSGFDVVAPTAVEVLAPTEHASVTLISCYPYLVNDKRIVIFADLATTPTNTSLGN